jgi:F5/8 type C domain
MCRASERAGHPDRVRLKDVSVATTLLQLIGQRTREFFLLQEEQRQSSSLAPAKFETMKTFRDAATRRLQAAQDLRGSSHTPAALPLYQQGSVLMALAFLVSKGRNVDPAKLLPEEVFNQLDAALAEAGVVPPSDFHAARPILLSADPLAFDRLAADEVRRQAEGLENATRWLATLVNARSVRELKIARFMRLAIAVLVALGLLTWIGIKIFSPKNYALNRPATASSVHPAYGAPAPGANDGSKSGRFDFCSAEEELPWWMVDMQKPVNIGLIKVFGRGDCCYDQSVPLALEVSDDGTTFRQIADRTTSFSEANPWVIRPDGVTARFIRLRTQRRSVLVLSEVEVYARKQ